MIKTLKNLFSTNKKEDEIIIKTEPEIIDDIAEQIVDKINNNKIFVNKTAISSHITLAIINEYELAISNKTNIGELIEKTMIVLLTHIENTELYKKLVSNKQLVPDESLLITILRQIKVIIIIDNIAEQIVDKIINHKLVVKGKPINSLQTLATINEYELAISNKTNIGEIFEKIITDIKNTELYNQLEPYKQFVENTKLYKQLVIDKQFVPDESLSITILRKIKEKLTSTNKPAGAKYHQYVAGGETNF